MKRIVLIVSVIVLTATQPLASDTFLNLGYNVESFNLEGYNFRINSLGPVWTVLLADEAGYYGQLYPYVPVSGSVDGFQFNYSDYGGSGFGLNFTIGYGSKMPIGQMGLLAGGGFVGDMFVENLLGMRAATWGVGGGARLYFTSRLTPMSANFGVDASWRPFGAWFIPNPFFAIYPINFNVNLNAGFRFASPPRAERTAGPAAQAAPKNVRPSLDESIEGPRRRIALDTVFGGGSMGSLRFWIFPVRDVWFLRAGAGFTASSFDPLLVNLPVSFATGAYPFPRRLQKLRLYLGSCVTMNMARYFAGQGFTTDFHNLGMRLVPNIGTFVGVEYNFTSHLGVAFEPVFFPMPFGTPLRENSWVQLAIAVRVM